MSGYANDQGTIGNELRFEMEAYLRSKGLKSEGTQDNYRRKLLRWVSWLETQGIQTLEECTPDHVRACLSSLAHDHTSGGVHMFYRVFKTWARWYAREYRLEGWDPLRNVEAPRQMNDPMPTTPIADVARLLGTCDRRTFRGCRDDALIRFLVDTGVRSSEALRLKFEDVDLNTGDVRLRAEATKSKKGRVVFLGAKALRSMRAYARRVPISPGMSVWLTEGHTPLTYWGLRTSMRRRQEEAGLEGQITPHTLRKTYATESYRHGEELETLRQKLGHSTLLVTQRYLGLQLEDLRESSKIHSPGDRLL